MFSNYSNLFRSGLLTDGASTSHVSRAPWASEYLGPRRGSLPMSIETMSIFSDRESNFNNQPLSSTSMHTRATAETPNTADSSLYFTFKKKRSGTEQHLSFLSLDLAESQSLRSESIKKRQIASPATKSASSSRPLPSFASPTYKES